MSFDHLTPETIGGLVDSELEAVAEREALAHLQHCHECSLRVLQAHQLKASIKKAASSRFLATPEALARMTASARSQSPKRVSLTPVRAFAWSALTAAVLLAVTLGLWQQAKQANTLSAELLDEHLAALSDSSQPQVTSSDKHTVKPWFQGKLPFSFNIPEPGDLPPETSLLGADLAYVQGRPVAMLLFQTHKHRVSLFITQGSDSPLIGGRSSRSGFNIEDGRAAGLEFAAISDVSRSNLKALVEALSKAQ